MGVQSLAVFVISFCAYAFLNPQMLSTHVMNNYSKSARKQFLAASGHSMQAVTVSKGRHSRAFPVRQSISGEAICEQRLARQRTSTFYNPHIYIGRRIVL